jgi:hypothetical protein
MIRRSFFFKSLASLIAFGGFARFTKAKPLLEEPSEMKGNFIHVVYFWLKEPADINNTDLLLKNIKGYLLKIDVILDSFIGIPANTPRDVVDNSYNFSIVLTFQSGKEQDIYQEHPAHKQFIEDSQHLWDKVQVYDSLRA